MVVRSVDDLVRFFLVGFSTGLSRRELDPANPDPGPDPEGFDPDFLGWVICFPHFDSPAIRVGIFALIWNAKM